MNGTILQVNVGRPDKIVDAAGREFTSAVRKRPVSGRVAVTEAGLAGDGSASLKPNTRYHISRMNHKGTKDTKKTTD